MTDVTKRYCDNCKKVVQLNQNAMCTNCESTVSYLTDIVSEVMSEDSKCYLIFNADKESINKADLNLENGHINKGAEVVQVTKDFFNQLEAVIHDKTPEGGSCGKVLLKNEPELIKNILISLSSHKIKLENDLGKSRNVRRKTKANQTNNDIEGQISLSLDEEFKLYETMWN